MDETPISVLIVDDSALMRNLIGKIVESSSGLVIAGKAMNGVFALQKLPRLDPDIIVLDLEMPEMNGIEFLKERKRHGIETPVVILSSLARKGAEVTMEALSLGASDFILKPSGSISEDIHTVGTQLTEMLLAYGRQYRRTRGRRPSGGVQGTAPGGIVPPRGFMPERPSAGSPERRTAADSAAAPGVRQDWSGAGISAEARARSSFEPFPRRESPRIEPLRAPGPVDIVAVGISTGGPNALREVFSRLTPDLDIPIVVVQHMPPGFTEEFAKSLDRICPLEVKEGSDGDILKPGRILIAPGDRHVEIEKRPLATILRLSDAPPVNGHRPSADVLFASVARNYGNRSLTVIMTGMGRDGAQEIGSVYREGGMTFAQDEQTCVVFGMPKVAIENGYIHRVVPLPEMAEAVCGYVRASRSPKPR